MTAVDWDCCGRCVDECGCVDSRPPLASSLLTPFLLFPAAGSSVSIMMAVLSPCTGVPADFARPGVQVGLGRLLLHYYDTAVML